VQIPKKKKKKRADLTKYEISQLLLVSFINFACKCLDFLTSWYFFLDDINEFNSHIIICVDLKLIQEGHRKYFFVINI
jgi:hypothetical protein